jgi:hypothetical protein
MTHNNFTIDEMTVRRQPRIFLYNDKHIKALHITTRISHEDGFVDRLKHDLTSAKHILEYNTCGESSTHIGKSILKRCIERCWMAYTSEQITPLTHLELIQEMNLLRMTYGH